MKVLVLFDDLEQMKNICDDVTTIAPDASINAFSKTSDAASYYRDNAVDVAFVDYAAKGIGSIPFSEGLKERWPQVNIIFCVDDKDVPPGIINKIRCSGLIIKPPKMVQVREELENLRYPVA